MSDRKNILNKMNKIKYYFQQKTPNENVFLLHSVSKEGVFSAAWYFRVVLILMY